LDIGFTGLLDAGAGELVAVVEAVEVADGLVECFADPLEPHALTATRTAAAPAEQARVLASCTVSP